MCRRAAARTASEEPRKRPLRQSTRCHAATRHQVTSPSGDHVYAAEREMEGSFAFYTTNEGTHN